jgi:hypothetical protein
MNVAASSATEENIPRMIVSLSTSRYDGDDDVFESGFRVVYGVQLLLPSKRGDLEGVEQQFGLSCRNECCSRCSCQLQAMEKKKCEVCFQEAGETKLGRISGFTSVTDRKLLSTCYVVKWILRFEDGKGEIGDRGFFRIGRLDRSERLNAQGE